MKLSQKLFSVHLLVFFILLLLVGITFEFSASRHFKEMEDRIEAETLTVLAYELALEYQRKNNWDEFRHDPGSFDLFIQTALRDKEQPGLEMPPARHPPDQPFPGGRHLGPPPEPFLFHAGIILYDAEKIRIAGPGFPDEKIKLRPILLQNRTVGWVGLHKRAHPVVDGKNLFLKENSGIFYIVGIIVFILAGMVSYGLSRHILSPVGRLTAGTKALASFRFDTRIDVRTTDELGQLAKDFNRMAQTLETYETMRKQWTVDISHELRTPLSVLKGELEAILDGVRPFTTERMESLHSEILYLEHIVNDLHFLSMADAGALAIKREPIRPVEILKMVLNLFETRFKQERMTVLNRLTCDNGQVSGDRDRIKQLFSNLIDNNLKYTRKPGTLTLRDKIENRMLIIHIEDSGPGVPPDAVDKLFNRLFRVDRSRSRKQGGSGLGLSICRTIASAHDGEIFASTIKNRGLAIILRLPLI